MQESHSLKRVEELDCKLYLKVWAVWAKAHFSVKLPIRCGVLLYVHLANRFFSCVGTYYSSFFG